MADAVAARTGHVLDDATLAAGIRHANRVRERLRDLRASVFTAAICPMPALEMLVAEMLAIHFCSDLDETLIVLDGLLDEVRRRIAAGVGVLGEDAARVFWVNPVADLRAMNVLEECGGRVCGTEYLIAHSLHAIPDDLPPLEALARTALADPMAGPLQDRARGIVEEARRFGCEAVVVSRIPGASHCAYEHRLLGAAVLQTLGLPVVELEVTPVSDAMQPTLRTRLEALVESVRARRCP